MAQIETVEAVENVDAIIGTEGIDAVFFGADDMKVRMGIPINTSPLDNDELLGAMERTVKAASAAGKVGGAVTGSARAARTAADMGYQMLIGGGDIAFMRSAAASRLAELRDELKQETADGASIKGGSDVYGG